MAKTPRKKSADKDTVSKIRVGDSPVHGQGVFAIVDIASGEVVERCPYIVIDDDDLQSENRLNDYLFTSPDALPVPPLSVVEGRLLFM